MIAPASSPALLRLSDAAAILTLAAVGAALMLPAPYAAVPDPLRPGAWGQDTVSAPAALALLAVNWRLRQGWAKGWLIWAGLVGYLLYAYGLYSFDGVMNPAYPLYLAVLALSVLALVLFVRAVDPQRLTSADRPPPRRAVAGLFGLLVGLFTALWLAQLLPAMAARTPLPGQTIYVLDLALALPLTGLTAWALWRGHKVGDLLAIPLLMKVAALGVSVFLGTLYGWAFFDRPSPGGDLALYALMGFGPALMIWPVWRGLAVRG